MDNEKTMNDEFSSIKYENSFIYIKNKLQNFDTNCNFVHLFHTKNYSTTLKETNCELHNEKGTGS